MYFVEKSCGLWKKVVICRKKLLFEEKICTYGPPYLSTCTVCDSRKLKLIKDEEASGLLSSLGIKTPLSKIPIVGLFCFKSIKQLNTRYKMNEIVNKFLLVRDKFIPKMHLRQHGFTYSACGPFIKNK